MEFRKCRVTNITVVCLGQVSDRMIYGPVDAVKIWATTRFSSLDRIANWTRTHKPGCCLHSETYVSRIVEQIRTETKIKVEKHETICFLRARVDGSVSIQDCSHPPPYTSSKLLQSLPTNLSSAVEQVLGRSCRNDAMPLMLQC